MPAKIMSAFISLVFISLASSVQASPQILGLMATAAPIPLTCEDGICKAEITTVCLQEHRAAPMPGRAYKAGQGTKITMGILGSSGQVKNISVVQKVSISARRHYTSVVISLPEKILTQLGHKPSKGQAVISVGAMASAVPVPDAADKKPLSAFEIEKYTGPLRQVAKDVLGRDSINVQTTQHLNQVINRLPDSFASDKNQFEKSWAKITNNKARKLTPAVKRATSQIAETCRYEYSVGVYATMRSCLEQHHDVLASDTNKKVWQAMKPGG
ncbi:MAG: hypothetical protein HN884_19605 [Rhodospirillaceae bacterium]|nr:hypothetical protein [Rhodospirillaceae bacterium]